jgi:chaperonin GroES
MSDIGLTPLFSRVIIKRKRIEKVGSLYVAETSQEAKVGIGEIIATGPDCQTAIEGDVVLFGRYAPYVLNQQEMRWVGVDVTEDKDTEYLLLNEEDLLAVKTRKEN